MDKCFTKERIALFVKYFMDDGRPVTVKQLQHIAEQYFGEAPHRQAIYSDLNAIDIVMGLTRETRSRSNNGERPKGYDVLWSYKCKH